MSKPSAQTGLGSLATGAVTALAIAVQTGLAAVVGVIIARELGRTAETVRVADGEPGVEVQVDFGRLGMLTDISDGRRREYHCWFSW